MGTLPKNDVILIFASAIVTTHNKCLLCKSLQIIFSLIISLSGAFELYGKETKLCVQEPYPFLSIQSLCNLLCSPITSTIHKHTVKYCLPDGINLLTAFWYFLHQLCSNTGLPYFLKIHTYYLTFQPFVYQSTKLAQRHGLRSVIVHTRVHRFPSRLTPVKGLYLT